MELCNTPIQMICVCAADGRMRPIRFRFEDSEHMLQTVRIDRVLSTNEVQFVGIEALVFLCRALLEQQEHLLELRYHVRAHRWVLQRVVY